ncbi:cholinephosphotransferase 1-like isoform X2 [Tubulanus polymorphus]|uniref:cholinephosphotransferase 1-like isoform X2 n=1 Tax=Tubulanus polymorphus TaxID=672921 RepID=UPI003DA4E96D
MADILSAAQLKRLADHKYSSEGVSIIEPYLQVFWRWLVEQIPLHWAPNALTSVGLFINVATSLLVFYYSPDAIQPAPAWVYLITGFGLIAYQSLDAIDGKQARRTGSSSPLGELFDHGCDSISTVFVTVSGCACIGLGTHPILLFYQCIVSSLLYYTAHWQTYLSGTLKFGLIDVTELQCGIVLMYLISAIFGNQIWQYTIPVINLDVNACMAFIGVPLSAFILYGHLGTLMKGGVGKNGATVADTSVVFPLFPIASVIILSTMIAIKSTSDIFVNHPCLYAVSFGIVAAKITNKLVVAHMTKSEMSFLDSVFVGPGMLFFNQYFNTLVSEYVVLWLCCVYCTIDLIRYSSIVCMQICDYLDIYCFKITPITGSNGADKESRMMTRAASKAASSSSNSFISDEKF